MPIKHVIHLNEGDIYVTPAQAPRPGFRRVVGVLGGRVMYSVGGDFNRACQLRTFKRWIRINNCITPRQRQTKIMSAGL